MTFKESVLAKLLMCANEYNKLIGIDFVITSKYFVNKDVYLLRFHKDNFSHLTGVTTKLYAEQFLCKCLHKTLKLEEFDCDNNDEIKGKVKEKMKNLSNIGNFFDRELIFQESFEKKRVKCEIATSDGKCTLGFIKIKNDVHVPLTLLNKNQIKIENAITDFKIEKVVK